MNRKSAMIIYFLFFSFFAFAQNISIAESRIREIEQIKNLIKLYPEDSSQYKVELEYLYNFLETRSYIISTKEEFLFMELLPYDKEKMAWPINLKLDFGQVNVYEKQVYLDYSDLLSKRFPAPDKMSEKQKAEYEFNIDYYDKLFRETKNSLHVEFKFRIQHWQLASEYRILPQEIKICKTEISTMILKTIPQKELEQNFFYMEPRIEIRTEDEVKVDWQRIQSLLADESYIPDSIDDYEESQEEEKPVKGRRNFYISTNLIQNDFDFSDINFSSLFLDYAQGYFNLAMTKNLFAGANFGYNLKSIGETPIYCYGIDFGTNLNFGKWCKPYIFTGLELITNNFADLKAGAGFDFIMGLFLINISMNYNWQVNIDFFLDNNPDTKLKDAEKEQFWTYSIGIGLAW